jgi:hypothetical protein
MATRKKDLDKLLNILPDEDGSRLRTILDNDEHMISLRSWRRGFASCEQSLQPKISVGNSPERPVPSA